MLAERSRFINQLLGSISQLKYDASALNRPRLRELVNTVNALLVPKAWIGLDDEGLLHVTYMTTERRDFGGDMVKPGPASLMMSADYAWEYIPWEQAYRCLKCRTDEFVAGQVVKAIGADEPQKCNLGPNGGSVLP